MVFAWYAGRVSLGRRRNVGVEPCGSIFGVRLLSYKVLEKKLHRHCKKSACINCDLEYDFVPTGFWEQKFACPSHAFGVFFKDTYTYQLLSAQYARLFSEYKSSIRPRVMKRSFCCSSTWSGSTQVRAKKDTKNEWILSLQTRKTKVLPIIPYVCLIKTFKCYMFVCLYVIYWDAKFAWLTWFGTYWDLFQTCLNAAPHERCKDGWTSSITTSWQDGLPTRNRALGFKFKRTENQWEIQNRWKKTRWYSCIFLTYWWNSMEYPVLFWVGNLAGTWKELSPMAVLGYCRVPAKQAVALICRAVGTLVSKFKDRWYVEEKCSRCAYRNVCIP